MSETEKADDEVDTYHAWDCSPAELTAEIERLSEENKRLREAVRHLKWMRESPVYVNKEEDKV